IRVVEAEHRLGMFDGDKPGRRPAADPLRWGVRGDEVRVFRLQSLELQHERVEFRVGYFRIVEDVVALFVIANQTPELGDTFSCIHRLLTTKRTKISKNTKQLNPFVTFATFVTFVVDFSDPW